MQLPYSKRTLSSMRIGTLPDIPLTTRNRSETPSRRDMKSVTRTVPHRFQIWFQNQRVIAVSAA